MSLTKIHTHGTLQACCRRVSVQTRHFTSSLARAKPRVVILGSGWGGYNVLRGIDKKDYNVTVISPNTYFNFTPLLASTAVGTLEFRCAIEPECACTESLSCNGTYTQPLQVRRYAPEATFYQAWCDQIDFATKQLKCTPATRPSDSEPTGDTDTLAKTAAPFTLHYDKLIIAVGAYSQTFNIPGVKEHAHFLKDVKDARKIRNRIFECFEQASQPSVSDIERRNLVNFCVVGGGPTGIEFSAELHDLIYSDVSRHYPALAKLCKITVYDVAPHILGSFDQSLRNYTEKTLSREGIRILTNHHVERVEKGKMIVKEIGEVPFGMLVWSTGLSPNPVVNATSDVTKDPKTLSLVTNEHLNVIMSNGRPNADVWAIGDAATIPDAPLPATAQVAAQKAKYMVKKLNKLAKDQESPEPFAFHNKGSLAYIGNWKAIYDRTPGDSEGFMAKETGRVAWLLWRSAYFTMTLSVRNKILIPTYWFLNWIFGRDVTRF